MNHCTIIQSSPLTKNNRLPYNTEWCLKNESLLDVQHCFQYATVKGWKREVWLSVSRPWLLRNIKVDLTIKREAINGPVDNLKEKTKVRKSPKNLESSVSALVLYIQYRYRKPVLQSWFLTKPSYISTSWDESTFLWALERRIVLKNRVPKSFIEC